MATKLAAAELRKLSAEFIKRACVKTADASAKTRLARMALYVESGRPLIASAVAAGYSQKVAEELSRQVCRGLRKQAFGRWGRGNGPIRQFARNVRDRRAARMPQPMAASPPSQPMAASLPSQTDVAPSFDRLGQQRLSTPGPVANSFPMSALRQDGPLADSPVAPRLPVTAPPQSPQQPLPLYRQRGVTSSGLMGLAAPEPPGAAVKPPMRPPLPAVSPPDKPSLAFSDADIASLAPSQPGPVRMPPPAQPAPIGNDSAAVQQSLRRAWQPAVPPPSAQINSRSALRPPRRAASDYGPPAVARAVTPSGASISPVSRSPQAQNFAASQQLAADSTPFMETPFMQGLSGLGQWAASAFEPSAPAPSRYAPNRATGGAGQSW